MSLQRGELYRFGKYQLDPGERTLSHLSGKNLPLSERAFETLCILVKNSGHLIRKDELMRLVWVDSFVEENNLDKCIHAIRRALGEKPGEQKFVETVRRHGYRFVAEVVTVDRSNGDEIVPSQAQAESNVAGNSVYPDEPQHRNDSQTEYPPVSLLSPAEQGLSRSFRFDRRSLVAFAILLVSAGLLVVSVSFRKFGEIPKKAEVKLAVLPLKPIDSGNRSEIYEIGVADTVINRINGMKGVFARPLNSVRKYTDLNQDAWDAGKEQQVDFVLASNYQLADSRIRITWHLVDVSSGHTEDTQTFESDLEGLFAVQDAVAAEIGNHLARRFLATYRATAARRGTANEEAYRLYLQGMYLYDRRTSADAQRAVEKLGQAIVLDPGYAVAWAGKAHAHRSLGNFGGSLSPHEQYKLSMAAVDRALTLDPDLSDAHSAWCENKFFYEYDFAGAERECLLAVETDPNSYLAHEIYARCLWTMSRFDESIREAKTAIDIEPTSLFSQRNYGISLFYARRYEEAAHQFRRVSDMDPNFVANYAWFVPALLVEGSNEEAFEAFIKWQTLMHVAEHDLGTYRAAYASDGWPGVGRERVKRFDEEKIRSYFLEACLISHTGNDEKVFEYLEKSLQRREWGIPFLRIDPSLDRIRNDRRFEDIAARVNVKTRSDMN